VIDLYTWTTPNGRKLPSRSKSLGYPTHQDVQAMIFSLAPCYQTAVYHCLLMMVTTRNNHASNGNPAYCSANDACACSEAHR
jgi:hypothetical protein